MTAQQAKQAVKNALYRSIGETSSALRLRSAGDQTLSILMYHKVNDIPDNPTTVPVARFDQQLERLAELGYQVVGLDAVLDHYTLGARLPERAVLITFDDGYRDTLENALPVLEKYGYPAVIFIPVAYMDDETPLPHETHLVTQGVRNRTLDWPLMRELDAGGVRVESHGIAHRPLAEVSLDESVREIAVSKLMLEEKLGRPVRAYAYVKGSEAHFHPVHESILKQAGYEIAFTSISRRNNPFTNPFRLGRYNVEPYPERTFDLVLSGACDLIALKDTVAGTHARRLFNQALGHLDPVRVVEYDPARRDAIAGLMERVWGTRPPDEELAWFYERNPVRPASVLIAELDGRTVATAAIAFARMSIGGEPLEVGMPLRVATDPAHRGKGIFGRLQAENEERVAGLGVRLLLTVPNAASAPVFLERLGWSRLPPLRVWARLRLLRRSPRGGRLVDAFAAEPADQGGGDRVLRDRAWLNWRFAAAPAGYRLLEGQHGGYAVTGRRGRLGVLACLGGDVLAQATALADGTALLASPPPARRVAYAFAGFLPSRRTFTLLGKALVPGQAVPAQPHFELGDLDFL